MFVHPDKNKAPQSEEAFKKLTEAYSCLNDPTERQKYDTSGKKLVEEEAKRRAELQIQILKMHIYSKIFDFQN